MAHSLGPERRRRGRGDRGAAAASCASSAATRSRATGCRPRWTRTAAWRFIRTWRRRAATGRCRGPGAVAPRALTDPRPLPILPPMDPTDTLAQLQALAARVDQLPTLAQRLADENRSLRQQQEQLAGERAQLLNEERTGALARGSDDHPPEIAGAAHVSAVERAGQRPHPRPRVHRRRASPTNATA